MAHHEEVQGLMESLKVASKHHVGQIMAARGRWKQGASAVNNSYRILNDLVGLNQLERQNGFFRTIGCRSQLKEHSLYLTEALTEILSQYQAVIYREHEIKKIGLRADAICLITKDNFGFCFILEVLHNETEQYLAQKINVWEQWDGALEYLSRLFSVRIPHFDFIAVRGGQNPCEKLLPLSSS